MKNKLTCLAVVIFIVGCSAATTIALVKTGAEAGTVAGLEFAKSKLPAADFTALQTGLSDVDTLAIATLNNDSTTMTLAQVLNLEMATLDPVKLAQYQAIMAYILPVINNLPGVSGEMNTVVSQLSSNTKAYAIALFTGNQTGCSDVPSLSTLVQNKPEVAQLIQKHGGDFDITILQNAFK
jgi:hypothetical protein